MHITHELVLTSASEVDLWRASCFIRCVLSLEQALRLSAHLLEATKESKYRDAAELSATFIKSQLYNGTIIIDTITLANCAVSELPVTYNPGFFIEGLSVYANVTGSTEWKTL